MVLQEKTTTLKEIPKTTNGAKQVRNSITS
jgi:hypothetical protein